MTRNRWLWPALVVGLFAALLTLSPGGFMGGGTDDWHYLEAARCWRAHGPCLPHDHWQGRWPLIAPMAAVTALLGENRWTVGLPDLAASVAALGLIAFIGNRLFGRPAGWIAALLLATVPIIQATALDPNVDLIELACLLAAAALLLAGTGRAALLAGFVAGLAFQVRETALAAVPPLLAALWLLAPTDRRLRQLALFAAAFLIPLAIELAVYASVTGDPLWRRHLSLAHSAIPSTEIATATAPGVSPLFNLDLIRGWSRQSGVHIHWLVDGFLNLWGDTDTGMVFLILPMLAMGATGLIPSAERRRGWFLAASAGFVLVVLIFAFAIDPKPRMMLAPLAAAVLIAAALALRLWRAGKRWQVLLAAAIITSASLAHAVLAPRWDRADSAAAQWIAADRGRIEILDKTRRNLALVPAAEALPPIGSGRPLLLMQSARACRDSAASSRIPPGSIAVGRALPLTRFANQRPGSPPELCLFRYLAPGAPGAIAAAMHEEARLLAPAR